MNGRTNQNWIERTCGRALALILSFVGLALVLLCASSSWAQTAPPAAKSNARPVTAVAAPAQHAKANGGNHEGITVHGHWVIEVKNPDGEVVRRVEFENSIDPGFTIEVAGATPIQFPGGNATLSALISGQLAPAASPWGILLAGPGGLADLTSVTNAPCVQTISTSKGPASAAVGACVIIKSSPFNDRFGVPCSTQTDNTGVFCNLSITPSGTGPNFTGLQLSGQATAQASGQITTVATLFNGSCAGTGCTSTEPQLSSFTSSTIFPGAPVSISVGQIVAVTVQFSFQ